MLLPNKAVLLEEPSEKSPEIKRLGEFTEVMSSKGGRATAYVCHGHRCSLPTGDVDWISNLLK